MTFVLSLTPAAHLLQLKQSECSTVADRNLYVDAYDITDYRADIPDIVPLLYQTGYLTIVGADSAVGPYVLGFPNEEVKIGFLRSLFPEYAPGAVSGSFSRLA